MYPNPGSTPVCVRRGDVREEEDVAARFQHRVREEEYPVCLRPAFKAGIICGDIREEEISPLKYRSYREEVDLISVNRCAITARCFLPPPA